jgi:uncharacterized circularly permuted ATP-grasp superfamily protein/uncharacterized alpha-E superfamily protein
MEEARLTVAAGAAPADGSLPPFDEMVTGGGQIRPHWQPLMGALRTLPQGALADRVDRARRQYDENGVTYNVFAETRGPQRPWQFDLIPMPIPAEEWAEIEKALVRRARLLDRILADIYGPQTLIRDRLLPPALVHANPAFLRPCHGIVPANGAPFLHFYAADLARGLDGRWRVCADRVNAPSGAGYALENRNVLMRTLPELFQSSAVRRLGPFFDVWQAALAQLAPRHRENPRIVLLTPGPYSETYFEHVYLARQLGLTLAEGADLTVRDAKVFLKTLGGLQQVDVILRRLDDDYCDPVELRSESAIGVAGLVDAVRAGSVAIANSLGAGVVETPALLPFLPGLATKLLGEDLGLPSVETWWLGQRQVFEQVVRRLEDYVFRPCFPGDALEPAVVGSDLEPQRRKAFVERLAQRPHRYVAQARLHKSAMPVWTPTGLVPRPLMVRCFLVRHEGGYVTMPGGMTRVAADDSGIDISMQRGGAAKDTWVIERDVVPVVVDTRKPAAREPLRRSAGELQSRVADNLYWLGRYAERLDNAARLMRASLMRVPAGGSSARELAEFHALARMLGDRGLVERSMGGLPDGRSMIEALGHACGRDQGLSHLFQAIQRIAPTVRDRLSADMWNVVNELLRDARLRLEGQPGDADRLLEGMDHTIGVCAAFHGMASENMTRGSGWRFLDLGRRIERALHAVGVVRDVFAASGQGSEPWLRLLLELCDSSITYRTRYMAAVQAAPVADLLLCDETNPRSVLFQLQLIAEHLDRLARRDVRPLSQPEQKIARAALTAIELFDVERIGSAMDRDATAMLTDLLSGTQTRLAELSEALTRAYFSHVETVQSIGFEIAPTGGEGA